MWMDEMDGCEWMRWMDVDVDGVIYIIGLMPACGTFGRKAQTQLENIS